MPCVCETAQMSHYWCRLCFAIGNGTVGKCRLLDFPCVWPRGRDREHQAQGRNRDKDGFEHVEHGYHDSSRENIREYGKTKVNIFGTVGQELTNNGTLTDG